LMLVQGNGVIELKEKGEDLQQSFEIRKGKIYSICKKKGGNDGQLEDGADHLVF